MTVSDINSEMNNRSSLSKYGDMIINNGLINTVPDSNRKNPYSTPNRDNNINVFRQPPKENSFYMPARSKARGSIKKQPTKEVDDVLDSIDDYVSRDDYNGIRDGTSNNQSAFSRKSTNFDRNKIQKNETGSVNDKYVKQNSKISLQKPKEEKDYSLFESKDFKSGQDSKDHLEEDIYVKKQQELEKKNSKISSQKSIGDDDKNLLSTPTKEVYDKKVAESDDEDLKNKTGKIHDKIGKLFKWDRYDKSGKPYANGQFDQYGNLIKQTRYDDDGNPINDEGKPEKIYDKDGRLFKWDRHDGKNKKDIFGIFDKWGNVIRNTRYDNDGNPVIGIDKEAKKIHDKAGKEFVWDRYDPNGKKDKLGEHDKSGNKIRNSQYDDDGNLISDKGLKKIQDKSGKEFTWDRYGPDGKKDKLGEYDKAGNKIRNSQYDKDGNLIQDKGSNKIQDKSGKEFTWDRYDPNGKKDKLGEYDQWGNKIRDSQYDKDGKPATGKDSNKIHDKSGKEFTWDRYGPDGKKDKLGEYDKAGNKISNTYYDKDGNPIPDKDKIDSNKISDKSGKQFKWDRFDESGNKSKTGEYDKNGKKIRQSIYDDNGNLISTDDDENSKANKVFY